MLDLATSTHQSLLLGKMQYLFDCAIWCPVGHSVPQRCKSLVVNEGGNFLKGLNKLGWKCTVVLRRRGIGRFSLLFYFS